MKVISIDAETDGLWGKPFSVAAVLYENGKELHRIVLRCNSKIENQWVLENVIPEMESIPVTNDSYESMLQEFAAWYMSHKEDATVLWHMGHVVETYLFREMVRLETIGEWDAPYTPIEVSEALRMSGYAPDSVDSAAKQLGISIPAVDGGTHNPLYDCIVSAEVYFALTK